MLHIQNHLLWKYKDITPHKLIPYLKTCDWTAFLDSDPVFDLESGLNCLISNLQMAIEELAPLKRVTPRKGNKPWVGLDLQFMIRKCDAIHARYGRNRDPELLRDFLKLRKEIEERTEDARSAFLKSQISDALDEGKNMWKKLRHLGLIPKPKEALHVFSLNELNNHFAGVLVSPQENNVDVDGILEGMGREGFNFKPVNFLQKIL